jgi:hypothetical protein
MRKKHHLGKCRLKQNDGGGFRTTEQPKQHELPALDTQAIL